MQIGHIVSGQTKQIYGACGRLRLPCVPCPFRMFYETRQPAEGNKKRLTLHLQKYIHWTGKNMKLMAKRVERAWEYGAFQKYFDEKYPQLTDPRGR